MLYLGKYNHNLRLYWLENYLEYDSSYIRQLTEKAI